MKKKNHSERISLKNEPKTPQLEKERLHEVLLELRRKTNSLEDFSELCLELDMKPVELSLNIEKLRKLGHGVPKKLLEDLSKAIQKINQRREQQLKHYPDLLLDYEISPSFYDTLYDDFLLLIKRFRQPLASKLMATLLDSHFRKRHLEISV